LQQFYNFQILVVGGSCVRGEHFSVMFSGRDGRAAPHRAQASQKNGGVLPDAVMIANGWLSVPDY
jgi:hypothetical protein